MKYLFLPLFLIILIGCSSDQEESELLKELKGNHEEMMNQVDSIFPAGQRYYVCSNLNVKMAMDSLTKYNALVINDESISKEINNELEKWLLDYIFIVPSEAYNGTFELDTTNLLLLENELDYYMSRDTFVTQNIKNRLIYINEATSHKVKTYYYDIVPVKKEYLGVTGKHILKTSDDYLSTANYTRVIGEKHLVDWHFTIASDELGELAFIISDTTVHYSVWY